jgi:DnaD/phage-associated family protein
LALARQGKLEELRRVLPEEARIQVERPNVFTLYEQNIGLLTPLIADQLRDLEKSYPPDWVDEAFLIAVAGNKRSLRYIQAILKRWETEGKHERTHEASGRNSEADLRRKYIPDEYSDVILG